ARSPLVTPSPGKSTRSGCVTRTRRRPTGSSRSATAPPVEHGRDLQPVSVDEQRQELALELGPLRDGKPGNRAGGRVELDHFGSRQLPEAFECLEGQRAERRGTETRSGVGLLRARRGTARPDVGVVEQRPGRRRKRRLQRVAGAIVAVVPPKVPEERHAPARAKDAVDLGDRYGPVEPVERVSHENGVDRRALERDSLGGPHQYLEVPRAPPQHRPHLVVWLDRDNVPEALAE